MGAAELNLFDLFAKISLDTSEYDKGVKDVSKNGESLASKLKSSLANAGKVAAAGIGAVTAAAGAAVGGLLALEQSTEEYRAAMGRLNTAFEAAGYGADTAQEAYRGFYGILGDTDTATEASQLLAQLADSAEDVSVWTNIAAGVSGTFGDSLPIEGLIEAANETAKVGQVTGVFADALNWAGISEDNFNEKLAACSDESERNKLIMDTLSDTYGDAADAFYRNNEAIVTNRENQQKLQESMAKIGDAVSKVKNAFIEQFQPVISEAAEYAANFISNIDPEAIVTGVQSLINVFNNLLPAIVGVTAATVAYKAAVAISSIIDAVRTATQNMSIAQAALNAVMNANPFVLIATLIAGVVAALITLWNTNEGFRNAVTTAWNAVSNTISGVVSTIKTFFTQTIPNAVSSAIEWFNFIPQKMVEIGANIVTGVWDGIQSMASWIKDKITGFFSGIVNGVKNLLGIHSPSRVFADMGKNMALGIGDGWDGEFGRIRKDIERGMNFDTASVDFASSGLGVSSAGIVNGVSSSSQPGGSYSFNLILPTGEKLASYVFTPLTDYAKANGTPILNPT